MQLTLGWARCGLSFTHLVCAPDIGSCVWNWISTAKQLLSYTANMVTAYTQACIALHNLCIPCPTQPYIALHNPVLPCTAMHGQTQHLDWHSIAVRSWVFIPSLLHLLTHPLPHLSIASSLLSLTIPSLAQIEVSPSLLTSFLSSIKCTHLSSFSGDPPPQYKHSSQGLKTNQGKPPLSFKLFHLLISPFYQPSPGDLLCLRILLLWRGPPRWWGC